MRRSFSQTSGRAIWRGQGGKQLATLLTCGEASEGYAGVHGFHPYPGRFHPALVRGLLAEAPGSVLDPFMGGGTTVVESYRQGRLAMGSDLNPIALLVSRERCRPRSSAEAQVLRSKAEAIVAAAGPVRVSGAKATALRSIHPPHVLHELWSLLNAIRAGSEGDTRLTLEAVFSAIVVKFSLQRSDSRTAEKRPLNVGKGFVRRFYLRKLDELLKAQVALASELPAATPAPLLLLEDARRLEEVGDHSVDVIITSPPYPGTYDYAGHHALRTRWLDLNASLFERNELGAARRFNAAGEKPSKQTSVSLWEQDLGAVFMVFSRVLKSAGSAYVVLGDWYVNAQRYDAAIVSEHLAERSGLKLVAVGAVEREPHRLKGGQTLARYEHLLHFTKATLAGR